MNTSAVTVDREKSFTPEVTVVSFSQCINININMCTESF
jgi:hypothetical protein